MALRSLRAGTPFVLVTVLLDTLGIGLIIPVGPRLVGSFLGDDLAAASRYFGLLFSLYSLMQFFFAPVLGGLSDRFGRRAVILTSLLGAASSYLLSGLAPTLAWIFVGRTIAGITGASFSAAGAYVADVTPPEKRAASFGAIGAVFGLGFILGPALGGLLGDYGLRVPYFVAAGLNFLNFVYGLLVLPESLRREDRRPFTFARSNPLGSLRNLAKHPIVLALTGTLFCAFMSQMILQSTWALHAQSRYGWNLRSVGLSLMVVGLATALSQGLLIRMIMPRLGERRILATGLALGACTYVGFAFASQGWVMLVLIFPLAIAGLAGPATQGIITREVGPSEQGQLQGSLNSLSGLAAIAGPLIGTTLLGRFGPPTAVPHLPGAAFLAAAAFNLLGLLLALRVVLRPAPAHVVTASAATTAPPR